MAAPTAHEAGLVQVIDNAGQEVFGERQANPTQYTLLERLQVIAAGLGAVVAAVTIADGADVALGATTDAEAAGDGSAIAILKRLRTLITATNALITAANALIAGGLPATLGQKAMAASLAVVLASDQSTVPVGVADGADVALGATTDAEALGDGSVIAITKRVRSLLAGGLPASLGQKTEALSLPVVLPSDMGDLPITLDSEAVVLGAGTAEIGKLAAGTATIGVLGANSGVDIGDVAVKSIAAGTNLIGKTQPFDAIREGGLTELIGINEEVNTDDYSGSIGVPLGDTCSGEILSVTLYATEDGSGAVQDSAGILIVFDADPEIASGAVEMTAAARVTVLGKVIITPTDWDIDAKGGSAYIFEQPISFHPLSTLYFVFKLTDSTDINDGAGDDEQLQFNFWYRRDS